MVYNRQFNCKIDLIHLIAQARKNFRPQSTNDDTVIAKQSDYVWDPEWSLSLFLNIPIDISKQAISTITIHKGYIKKIPLTIDATPLNYNSFLLNRQQNNSQLMYNNFTKTSKSYNAKTKNFNVTPSNITIYS